MFLMFFTIFIMMVKGIFVNTAFAFEYEGKVYEQEQILSFLSDIHLSKEGEISVTETIKVYANGRSIKRGIFRSLPLKRNLNNRTQRVKYKNISIERDGKKEKFKKETMDNVLVLYIGDPDYFLPEGVYEYKIHYTTKNQIGFFEEFDEFYWNVNGNDWDFKIDSVATTIHFPSEVYLARNACYVGSYGEDRQDCQFEKTGFNTLFWSATDLDRGEGLTIAAGVEKGTFVSPQPPSFWERNGIALFLFLSFFIIAYRVLALWKRVGVDPPKPTVMPEFDIPNNFSPAGIGYLKRGAFAQELLTASIINLAIKGHIKIEESKKTTGVLGLGGKSSFTIIKNNAVNDHLAAEEKLVFQQLFSKGKDSIKIDGEYNSSLAKLQESYKKIISTEYKSLLKEESNLGKLVKYFLISGLIYLIALATSWWVTGDEMGFEYGVYLGIVLSIVSLFMLSSANTASRFKSSILNIVLYVVIFGFILLVLLGYFLTKTEQFFFGELYEWVYLFLFGNLVFFAFFAYLIKRPTEEKLALQAKLLGFKMFMGAAENERIKFNNPPNITPEIYEKLLPYAIVLGVDKVWGETFQKQIKNSSIVYEQNWYSGRNMNHNMLNSSMNSSFARAFSSATVAPSTSSGSYSGGSFSSGSSGGGFSGGGGGGGGGGGW